MIAFPPIEELVPHAGPMLLLDRVIAREDDTIWCELTIRRDSIFFQRGKGVPAYVGFEFMAQAISAYDGLKRRANGAAPAIGFLLGCRKYDVAKPFFNEGETLKVEAISLLGEEGMASFECRILGADDAQLATATVNVYRPANPEAFLQAQT